MLTYADVCSSEQVLVYLPGAETNTVAKDLLPDSLMGHDVLVIRVEGTLNFTAASSLRHTFFFFRLLLIP
jgi:hypothetical protein